MGNKQMRRSFVRISLALLFTYSVFNYPQVSPKEGIKPPADFLELQQLIQSDYSHGYYADKFKERKQLREQISQGLLPESILVQDTVFALTLMGQFTDLAGFYTQQQFQAQLYDGPNSTGTVTEYYAEVSYDQLFFTGDAQGWYNVLGPIQNYSPGSSSGGPKFVVELIQASDPTLNYADYIQYYDSQNRPHIGFLAIVHAGAGAEAGAYNIWSHRWNFTVYSGGAITTNDVDPISGFNVIIDGPYAIMPERSGGSNTSGSLIEIGVFAHEFGHIFGLPDLYDTDGSSEGLGNWCLMAGGSWGGNGSSPETPVHMSAWCKKELGWLTPINITSALDSLVVPDAETNPIVYRMWRDAGLGNQYFLIENRQKIGFDEKINDSGFLIYHVDESQNNNQNENHYKVDLEQADGFRNLNNGQNRGDTGDPFPGSSQNNRFDWGTNPNSKDYNFENTFVSVRNIYKDGNVMVGDFEVAPRSGVHAFADPISIDFGEIEVGTNSFVKQVILANYGDQDLVITNIPDNVGAFDLETTLLFPISLSPFDSLKLAFRFSPSALGNFSEVYPITSNDPSFSGYILSGSSFNNYPALDKTFYASSGDQNNGEIITIDPTSGTGTLLGPSSFDGVKSISIHPETGTIYGLVSRIIDADIIKVNAGGGDSHLLFTLDLQQMAGISFDTSGVLYGISRTGMIYKIDIDNGTYDNVVDAVSIYSGIAFHPLTNELWASSASIVGSNVDAIFKVDLATGDTTIVGHTGLGKRTNDIIFDEDGNLFGVIGSESEVNDFVSLNSLNGTGSIIGSIGYKNILGLAFEETGVTSIENENNDNLPFDFALHQNFPNPFNPSTTISFQISNKVFVSLKVYDVLGKEVAVLLDEELQPGIYEKQFKEDNLSSGIYFYRLVTENFIETRKMVLIK